MDVQSVLDRARERLHMPDSAPPPERAGTARKVIGRLVLPAVALAGIAALLRPRRPRKPKSRFPFSLSCR